jgi:hypothetical protein
MPTSRPVSPSSRTTGNSTWARPAVSPFSALSNVEPVNSGMITPAARIPTAVRAPSAIRMIQNSVEARRNASRFLPCWSRSVNTGTNAAESAACANRLLIRFGIWEAIVNAEAGPPVPNRLAATTSRARPAIREKPVATAKIAVLTPSRRRGSVAAASAVGASSTAPL